MMTIIFGALGISSVAATVGLTTGQTYLTIAGFVVAASIVIVSLYRKQSYTESNSSSTLDEVEQKSQ